MIAFNIVSYATAWDFSLRAFTRNSDFKLVFRNDITKFFNYEPGPDYSPN